MANNRLLLGRQTKRKPQFKKSEGSGTEVCNLVEEYGRECAEENAKANAYNLFKNGVSYELVRVSIEILSDEELRIFMEKDIVKRYLQKLLL